MTARSPFVSPRRPRRVRVDGVRGAAPAAIAASVFVIGASAAAQPSPPPKAAAPITLVWTAPGECPTTAEVSARVEKLLGGPPAAADRRLEAIATVEPLPRGYRLEISLTADGATSGRILQGARCDSVADAAALVIALAFDPEAVAAQEAKQGVSETPDAPADSAPVPSAAPSDAPPPPPPPAAPAIVRIPVPIPPPPRPPPPADSGVTEITYGFFAQLVGDAGSLSSVVPGVRAGLSLGIGPYRIEPAFIAFPSAKSALPDRPTAGAEMRLLMGSLDACRRLWPWSARSDLGLSAAHACLGFEVGEMHGAGFGVTVPRSGGTVWAAPHAGLRAELSLARNVALTVDLGVAIPLNRSSFVLTLTEGRAVVHEPSAVAGRAGAGLALRF